MEPGFGPRARVIPWGRIQIEFEDEAPEVRPLFDEECRKSEVKCEMPPL